MPIGHVCFGSRSGGAEMGVVFLRGMRLSRVNSGIGYVLDRNAVFEGLIYTLELYISAKYLMVELDVAGRIRRGCV